MKSLRNARWLDHAGGLGAPGWLRRWLTDRASLTQKLIRASAEFRVRRLRQGAALGLHDEFAQLALPRRTKVQEREVLLVCDARPVVFAHTIVAADAGAADWPFFAGLGERSLGTTLFGDPLVKRGAMQFARLAPSHPLAQRARAAAGADRHPARALAARRCLFRRKKGVLLVTEVFLPALDEVAGVTGDNDTQNNR